MEIRITVAEFARTAGEALGKVLSRGHTFVIESNGKPVAKLTPWPQAVDGTLLEGLRSWCGVAPADKRFADDLERVNHADRVPQSPWE